MTVKVGISAVAVAVLGSIGFLAAHPVEASAHASCSGGSHYTSFTGHEVQFGSTAVRSPDGTVRGQGQSQIASVGFKVHYRVLDILLVDNTCWILGEVTKGDAGSLSPSFTFPIPDLSGRKFLQSIKDDGEGEGAADKVGGAPFWYAAGNPITVLTPANIPNPAIGFGFVFHPIMPLTEGNIQVRNPN